jgi:hypothetical protein
MHPTLALRVRSLREGGRLTVKEPDRRRIHFAPWNGLPASPVPSPMRKNGAAHTQDWVDWPAATGGGMKESASPMLVVYDGRCRGFLFNRGPKGWEAFDADDQSFGIFETQAAAAAAIPVRP